MGPFGWAVADTALQSAVLWRFPNLGSLAIRGIGSKWAELRPNADRIDQWVVEAVEFEDFMTDPAGR